MYHIDRLYDWSKGKDIYPIYMEVSPAGACNHRCLYCGLDFMDYKPRYLDTNIFKKRLTEMGTLGVRSIMYAGEGEPFLHKDIANITRHTKKSGIDAAITTNGVLFNKDVAGDILQYAEWIKIGIDGATPETYSKIHRCSIKDFDNVITNISDAVKIKRDKGYKCTIGIQLLLLPENSKEVLKLAKAIRDIRADYLIIKPYSQHIQSKTRLYNNVKYADYEYLRKDLASLNTEDFKIIFRINTMKKWDEKAKQYARCLALPFWSYIDAGGNIWGCSVYIGNDNFLYGNIYENSFKEIWEGERRAESIKWVEKELDISKCRINCRMDEINKYLWELKNSPEHVNFI